MFNKEEQKLDVDYIINIVQNILNNNHTDPRKKELKLKLEGNNKELNMNCPICGDGHGVRFRGHLYLNSLRYVCYNEREADSMSFNKFCEHFGVKIDLKKKMDIYNYIDNNWAYTKKDDFLLKNMDKLLSLNDFSEHIKENPTFLFNFRPITEGSVQWNYLMDRKIHDFTNIWEATYKITNKWFENVIVILNRSDDKLIGMQLRNLKTEKNKRIYKFINFQELYNMRYPEDVLDEFEAISYNKLSAIFNIMNVDFERTVYVFEGYLDSLFFPNSLALVGLDTDISIFADENVDIKFVLDNDAAGLKKAKKMIDDKYSVFLWKKLINHLSKGKSIKYKQALLENKDINKLVQFYGNPNLYHDFNLDKFFAIDQFDLIDL